MADLGLKMLLVYVKLELMQSPIMHSCFYFRFTTLMHLSFWFFNSEGQHGELMPKFSGQTRNRMSSKGEGGDESAQDD